MNELVKVSDTHKHLHPGSPHDVKFQEQNPVTVIQSVRNYELSPHAARRLVQIHSAIKDLSFFCPSSVT